MSIRGCVSHKNNIGKKLAQIKLVKKNKAKELSKIVNHYNHNRTVLAAAQKTFRKINCIYKGILLQ